DLSASNLNLSVSQKNLPPDGFWCSHQHDFLLCSGCLSPQHPDYVGQSGRNFHPPTPIQDGAF
ncbi:MAG: hypothetical protein QGG39_02700, partial [Candidatus Poribacteria bacterium]|nr:hypothetical protein [Candidatus Poribacteria bacterium]